MEGEKEEKINAVENREVCRHAPARRMFCHAPGIVLAATCGTLPTKSGEALG